MITVVVVAGILTLVKPWEGLSPFLICVGLPGTASCVVIGIFALVSEILAWLVSR